MDSLLQKTSFPWIRFPRLDLSKISNSLSILQNLKRCGFSKISNEFPFSKISNRQPSCNSHLQIDSLLATSIFKPTAILARYDFSMASASCFMLLEIDFSILESCLHQLEIDFSILESCLNLQIDSLLSVFASASCVLYLNFFLGVVLL